MLPDEELEAIGRIMIALKNFRRLADQISTPATNRSRAIYLEAHLSAQDWLVWQQLQADEPVHSMVHQEGLSILEFKQLLGAYKRVSYESFQTWIQSLDKLGLK